MHKSPYLELAYGISAEEAQLRLELQEKVIELSEQLNAENDPNYADMYIKHTPVYKIVVLFADNKDRHQFLKSLDPKMRKYVQLKNVKKSRSQYERELSELGQEFSLLNIPYEMIFDLEKQKFVVAIEQKEYIKEFRKAAQKLKKQGEIDFEVRAIAKDESAPTNVRSGDKIYSGVQLWKTVGDNAGSCTAGYAVTYTIGGVSKKGILTSAHCSTSMLINMGNNRHIGLHNPDIKHYTRNHDYQIWETTGISLNNQVHFKNSYGIPEFAKPTGNFRVTQTMKYSNQKAGMIVCKSGAFTGITCGTITNANATFNNQGSGWVKVENSKQPDISTGGDSGGPWFVYPGKSTTITAVGVHKAGSDNPDYALYMPIDKIKDHNPTVQLILK